MKIPTAAYGLYRQFFWRNPIAYRFLPGTRIYRKLYRESYDAWITGYPRSGNSYGAESLRRGLGPGVNVSSHCHNPAFVKHALSHMKPGILLIRDPVSTVISNSIYTGHSLVHEMRRWIDFHTILLSLRNRIDVLPFPTLIEAPDSFFRPWARRNSFPYQDLPESPETVRSILVGIEERAPRNTSGEIDQDKVSLPSPHRNDKKRELRRSFEASDRLRALAVAAEAIYEEFAG
jgi:hypothetical protein